MLESVTWCSYGGHAAWHFAGGQDRQLVALIGANGAKQEHDLRDLGPLAPRSGCCSKAGHCGRQAAARGGLRHRALSEGRRYFRI